jgi:hypothetical protein
MILQLQDRTLSNETMVAGCCLVAIIPWHPISIKCKVEETAAGCVQQRETGQRVRDTQKKDYKAFLQSTDG